MKSTLWLPALAILVMITGCANQADSQHNQYEVQQTGEVYERADERLEHLAEQFPQVNSANCVLIGKTAIIGLDVDGTLDREEVDSIKYTVAEAIQKDPYGAKAWVTADVDVNQRLRDIASQVRKGHPVAGFAGELADMVGRMMPQASRDTK